MKNKMTLLCLLISAIALGQNKRILFIGDSYTIRNGLPTMVKNVAASVGHTIVIDSFTRSATSLKEFFEDQDVRNKIQQSNWDYVVLQEKSYLPAAKNFKKDVYPYARSLDSLIKLYNPCSETVFYMTWAREQGLSNTDYCSNSWPYACNYKGMDSLIDLRYRILADSNRAVISPVRAVWNYIKSSTSIGLYEDSNGHPTLAGTYIAACTFYTTLLRKNPRLITYVPSTLSSSFAETIRDATKSYVYNHLLDWHIGQYDPVAGFLTTVPVADREVKFMNTSGNANYFEWNFGDGSVSNELHPAHTYAATGQYNVTLTAKKNSSCLAKSTVSTSVTASTVINMKSASEFNCTGTLYDNGGPVENYLPWRDDTLVIKPSGATRVRIKFEEWAFDSQYDFLKIYDGTSKTGLLKGTWSASSPGTVDATTGIMTLIFHSNQLGQAAGWRANWTSIGGTCPSSLTEPTTLAEESSDPASTIISLYPNPTTGMFTIYMTEKYDQFLITDILGHTVKANTVTDKQLQVDLSGYPAGLYFIQLKKMNEIKMQKIILK